MEELIEPSPGTRVLRWTAGVSVAVLLATALADQVAPLGPPRLVGQERAREKALAGSAHFSDGSLAQLAERHLRLNSRVRRRVAPYWIAMVTRYLKSATDEIVVGRHGWLFLRERALSTNTDPAHSLTIMRRLCLAMDRRLSGRGTRIVWIPVPRKATVAEALLPEGFAHLEGFDSSTDRRLIDGLLEDGAWAVDATKAWSQLPAGAAYLPLDTHWSDLGQRTLAAEVARLHPAPDSARFEDFKVTRSTEPARAALLDSIGVGEDYPPGAIFPRGTTERVVLAPGDVPGPAMAPWAVLAGTSFTADFDFHAHLSLATRSRMGKTAMAATAFGTPLAYTLAQYGSRALPGTIFVEFPVHDVFTVGRGLKRVQLGVTQVFALLPPGSTVPFDRVAPISVVGKERRDGVASGDLADGQTVLRYGAGQLLSSGEGVISLLVDVQCDLPSRWELRLAGMGFTWKAEPGRTRIFLPVIEAGEAGQPIDLVALDANARAASVTMEPFLDADPSGVRRWSGTEPIARHDLARVGWPSRESPSSISIRATGRTPEGERVEATWTFRDARSSGVVLGLARFRGGSLDTITVTDATGAVVEAETEIVSRDEGS